MVATFERKTAKRNCAEPLNSDCDPVNGVASLPWNDGCVGVAVGLVHMASRGRIVEVCGNSVRSFYSKTYALDSGIRDRLGPVPEDYFTVAFFGLAAANDALWAVGNDGIYQIRPNGSAEFTPLPSFKKVGNVFISFDRPDMVLVLTDINQRRSVSGSVPLMVLR